MNLIQVRIWEKLVGVLVWNEETKITSFQYSDDFIRGNLQLSPLINPLSPEVIKAKPQLYTTDESIDFNTNKGLPLFISDSLPDKFGTTLFAKYLEKEGKSFRDLTPIEKLSYVGERGMGALEYLPVKYNKQNKQQLNLKVLNELSQSLLNDEPIANLEDMSSLFHIGTSPGGAQPKVLINIDKRTGNIYRGDIVPKEGQESWILKFNRDIGEQSDKDRGKVEYAYYLIARNSGIQMMDSELQQIGEEYCFMTKRFDREEGIKLHTQTLHAFAGMNFKLRNTYSYEQVFTVLNKINLSYPHKEQLFRTMVFNIIGRNVDDHTKNFGFRMDKSGEWTMSPAYDLTFTYNENYKTETPHFLSINGKNRNIGLNDIMTIAVEHSIKNPKSIINQVNQSFQEWEEIANRLEVSTHTKEKILSKLKTIPYVIK